MTWKNTVLAVALVALAPAAHAAPPSGSAADAKAFIDKVDAEYKDRSVRASTTDWVRSTYITDDTERLSSIANDELAGFIADAISQAKRWKGVKLDADTARKLLLLRGNQAMAAPRDAKLRRELTTLAAALESEYGKAKACSADGKKCRDLGELEEVLAKTRNPDEALEAWVGWHQTARPQRARFQRFVELANQGAREIDFADTGALWRSNYDMSPADFEKETNRLWQQVAPLYQDLHCYVRGRLHKTYGDKVPLDKPIPAHLLGNMWAQAWDHIYPLVEPFPGKANLDVTAALEKQGWDAVKMAKTAESFFTSMGLPALPATFWERSMLTKPRDRDVVCHASAWDVTFGGDVRIKMCIKPTEEHLTTLHHELGHDYYYLAYHTLPALYQTGAHDGFHEAIGDTIRLSMTPAYLKQLGLIAEVPTDAESEINVLMKMALERVAFLPFGLLIDQWRWDVFSGKTKPADYNKAWWALREKLEGVAAPLPRTEEDFDPGAKYHVPANVPYTRYFLAQIVQYQFYRALCRASGYTGPLNQCNFYGSKEAGKKLWAMLQLGASKPWPEAMATISGEKQMDAGALLEYYAPLQAWLKEQNKGMRCGW
jgi:peptidyl-dipeptidase A